MHYHEVFGTEGLGAVRAALDRLAGESDGRLLGQSSVFNLLRGIYAALPLASGTDLRRVRQELSELLDFAMRWDHGEA